MKNSTRELPTFSKLSPGGKDRVLGELQYLILTDRLRPVGETADMAEPGTLDFARLKIAGNTRQLKACKKGFPCGFTCISRSRRCQEPLEGQAYEAAAWLRSRMAATSGVALANKTRHKRGATVYPVQTSNDLQGSASLGKPAKVVSVSQDGKRIKLRPTELTAEQQAQNPSRYNREEFLSDVYATRAEAEAAVAAYNSRRQLETEYRGQVAAQKLRQESASTEAPAAKPDPTARPIPAAARAAGIRNWEAARKKGLMSFIPTVDQKIDELITTDDIPSPSIRQAVIADIKTRLIRQAGIQGGAELAIRSVILDADRLARNSDAAADQQAYEVAQRALRKWQAERFAEQQALNMDEGSPRAGRPRDVADDYSDQAMGLLAPTFAQWGQQIADLADNCQSFGELQARLIDLYGDLDSADLAEVLGAGLAAADAAGRYEVLTEEDDPPELSEALDFARLKIAGNTQQPKACKKGYACGNSCISKTRVCRKELDPTATAAAGYIAKSKGKTVKGKETAKGKAAAPPEKPATEKPTAAKTPVGTFSNTERINAEVLDKAVRSIGTEGIDERVDQLNEFAARQGVTASISKYRHEMGYSGNSKAYIEDAVTRYNQQPQAYRDERAEVLAPFGEIGPVLRQKLEERFVNPDGLTTEQALAITAAGADPNAAGYTSRRSRFVVVTPESEYRDDGVTTAPSGEFSSAGARDAVRRSLRRENDGLDKDYTLGEPSDDDELNPPDATTTLVYIHEMGHQVKFAAERELSDDPDEPISLEIPSGVRSVSEYGDVSDPEEWFAESFAAYMVDSNAYRDFDPVGHAFVEQTFRTAARGRNG